MRLFVAAAVFLAAVFAITSLITAALPANAPEWLTGVAILISAVLSLFLANALVNVRGTRFWSLSRARESAEQLEQLGMLNAAEFHATRAFQVEEREHEGPHYFIELRDKAVLYLSGPYLRDHEPIEFDDEMVQRREFPCTEFTIRRRDDGTVVDLQCGGRVLEPEVVAPPFSEEEVRNNALPKDGDIIRSSPYDALKAARLKQGQSA